MVKRCCDTCGIAGDQEMISIFSAPDPVDYDEWLGIDNGSPEPIWFDWCQSCYDQRENLLKDPLEI